MASTIYFYSSAVIGFVSIGRQWRRMERFSFSSDSEKNLLIREEQRYSTKLNWSHCLIGAWVVHRKYRDNVRKSNYYERFLHRYRNRNSPALNHQLWQSSPVCKFLLLGNSADSMTSICIYKQKSIWFDAYIIRNSHQRGSTASAQCNWIEKFSSKFSISSVGCDGNCHASSMSHVSISFMRWTSPLLWRSDQLPLRIPTAFWFHSLAIESKWKTMDSSDLTDDDRQSTSDGQSSPALLSTVVSHHSLPSSNKDSRSTSSSDEKDASSRPATNVSHHSVSRSHEEQRSKSSSNEKSTSPPLSPVVSHHSVPSLNEDQRLKSTPDMKDALPRLSPIVSCHSVSSSSKEQRSKSSSDEKNASPRPATNVSHHSAASSQEEQRSKSSFDEKSASPSLSPVVSHHSVPTLNEDQQVKSTPDGKDASPRLATNVSHEEQRSSSAKSETAAPSIDQGNRSSLSNINKPKSPLRQQRDRSKRDVIQQHFVFNEHVTISRIKRSSLQSFDVGIPLIKLDAYRRRKTTGGVCVSRSNRTLSKNILPPLIQQDARKVLTGRSTYCLSHTPARNAITQDSQRNVVLYRPLVTRVSLTPVRPMKIHSTPANVRITRVSINSKNVWSTSNEEIFASRCQ